MYMGCRWGWGEVSGRVSRQSQPCMWHMPLYGGPGNLEDPWASWGQDTEEGEKGNEVWWGQFLEKSVSNGSKMPAVYLMLFTFLVATFLARNRYNYLNVSNTPCPHIIRIKKILTRNVDSFFFLSFFVLNHSDLVGIFHLQHILVQTSHTSRARLPDVACDHHPGCHKCGAESVVVHGKESGFHSIRKRKSLKS